MNNSTKNTNITVGRHNLSRTFALWNNVKQSATTINELTESMIKDFHKPESIAELTSMNRDVKKILQTAITLKRNMDVITGRLEAAMIIRDANQAAAARLLSDCEDDIAKEGIAKEEPGEPEASQLAPTLAEWSTLLSSVETFINNVARHLTNITNIDFCTGQLREPATSQQQTKDDKPDVSHRDLTTAEWNDCLRELEASMTDTTRCLTARDLDVCDDQLSEPTVDKQQDKDDIAKEEPVKATESPQNEPVGVDTAYTAKMEETPAKPVVEPPKVKTPVFSFIPTLCDTNFDVLTLDGFSTIPYAAGVRVTGEEEMPFQYALLALAIKKVIDTLNDIMTTAATLNPFPARPEDFLDGVYCGFKNVKFTIINADWVTEGSTAVSVTIEHEVDCYSCTTGRNVVVCDDTIREDVLEHGLKALAEGANALLSAVSQQAK